jgi:hypothetical protein
MAVVISLLIIFVLVIVLVVTREQSYCHGCQRYRGRQKRTYLICHIAIFYLSFYGFQQKKNSSSLQID